MPNLRLSLVITFLATNAGTAVNFLVTIVLSRLLSPSEIGIFSIAAVLVSIVHVFRDFGVGSYLQCEKDLTPEKIRAASGILITSSWAIALILFSLSGHIAEYFDRPELKDVVRVLSLGFIFIPFGAITHILLTREYRAREQTIVRVFSVAAYAISSIAMAYYGFSYMTMAWANLVNIISVALAYIPFRPSYAPWLPSFRGWKNVIQFGGGVIIANSVRAVDNSIPDIMLGKLSGPHDVGIFSRANGTTNIFTQIAGPTIEYATLPFLAKEHHAGKSLEPALTKAIAYLTAIAWPAIAMIAIFAKEIVIFLYGEKWIECVPIVQITSMILMVSTPLSFSTSALMAIGHPYLAAIPVTVCLALKMLIIFIFFDGSLQSFAYILLVATLLMSPITLWLQARLLDLGLTAMLKSVGKSFAISVGCIIAGLLAQNILNNLPPFFSLTITAITLLPLWAGLVKATNHPIQSEIKAATEKFYMLRWISK